MYTGFDSPVPTGRHPSVPVRGQGLPASRQFASGFTLVELLVAVAIVVILATLALPNYQESLRKSRRADAVLALQQIQIEQEKLRAECSQYASGLGASRVCDAALPANNRLAYPSSSPDAYYTLALSGASATGFTATATAASGKSQADDAGCTALTLIVSGLSMTKSPAACWSQ